ncbi:hypothetical protein HK405_008790 [Cladochytrium tenue]|nr:hypothetical protein HK405_008790 [Cladochytrium tenue]
MLGHSRLTGAPVDTLTADGDSVAVLAGKLRQYSATVRELEDRLVQSEDLWLHRTKAAEHEMREEIKSLKGAMSLRDKDVAELERELASTKLQLAEAQAKLAGPEKRYYNQPSSTHVSGCIDSSNKQSGRLCHEKTIARL